MTLIGRRNILTGGVALGSALLLPSGGGSRAAEVSPSVARPEHGRGLTPAADANPQHAKITVFTVVSADVDASIRFYTQVMGFTVLEDGELPGPRSTAPGARAMGRRYALIHVPQAKRGASIRILQAPRGAEPIRPRPQAKTWDPGLLCMECGTRDPAESYHVLASAKTPTISPPRYYPYRGIGMDVDPMSYSAFGPSGEQMFITASISNERPEWTEPGLHTVPGNAAIVSLDQRPVDDFYLHTVGLKRTNQFVSQQRNCNELIGAPRDANFLWGNIGSGVSIEVWEFKVAEGTVYPTSLDRTGLAMLTLRVSDLQKCRNLCREAGITAVGEGALPVPGNPRPEGFTLRGAVGELVEVVGA